MVSEAIALAGGLSSDAGSTAVILHTDPKRKPRKIEVDVKAIIEHRATDIELFGGDSVFIPDAHFNNRLIATGPAMTFRYSSTPTPAS
jgi:protein involved in polysaccharide export with SLBB domain